MNKKVLYFIIPIFLIGCIVCILSVIKSSNMENDYKKYTGEVNPVVELDSNIYGEKSIEDTDGYTLINTKMKELNLCGSICIKDINNIGEEYVPQWILDSGVTEFYVIMSQDGIYYATYVNNTLNMQKSEY